MRALRGKKVSFDKVIKMVDDMVTHAKPPANACICREGYWKAGKAFGKAKRLLLPRRAAVIDINFHNFSNNHFHNFLR